jgi:hypothetical protein
MSGATSLLWYSISNFALFEYTEDLDEQLTIITKKKNSSFGSMEHHRGEQFT